MPGRSGVPKSRLPLELRLIRWLFRMAWRLLVALLALIGLLLWLLAWPLRRSGAGTIDWPSAEPLAPVAAGAHRRARGQPRALRVPDLRVLPDPGDEPMARRPHPATLEPSGARARAPEPAGSLRRLQSRQGRPLRDRLALPGAKLTGRRSPSGPLMHRAAALIIVSGKKTVAPQLRLAPSDIASSMLWWVDQRPGAMVDYGGYRS
jgi:hypothetical protein